ncbi:MAG: FAD-dependent oxidoreductase, partial [Proteobacteria bacterium]|nr:FAD-dependent oxidoreductase [Pseudomonadota bacterium]
QTGRMVGIDIPTIPVEHQFIVTEPHPLLEQRRKDGLPEMPVLRESDASYYLREERQGLLLGIYEKGAPACFVDGVPATFEKDLFPGDLDRLEPHIEAAINRVPIFGEAGVKEVINGPIAYTPDGSPLVGPAWGLRNFWINEGHSFGVTAAAGAGWQLAEWMVEGEPTIDMLGVDPRRFGDYASKAYLKTKNEEAYENVFVIHFHDEERPACRPLKTAPCYDRMKAVGAVFGQKFGWERPNWFAPEGVPREDDWSFRRSKYFEHVGNECRNVHENVGLLDMTAFSKFTVSGPGAEAYLDNLVANRIPKKVGRVNLCHALNANGGVSSEFTIMREGPEAFYLVSAGAQERYDWDTLCKTAPGDGSVRLDKITTQVGVLVVAGPKSRELMSRVTDADLSNEAFPWLTGKFADVGLAPCRLMRINFVGELGWEIHHPLEMQNHIFDALMAAGEGLDFKPFGIRAMDALRIEKSYRLVGTELSIEYAAFESGLQRFVHPNKGDFIGRDALVAWQQRGFANHFVTLEVDGITDADAIGNEPLFKDGEMIGRATAGGYGWRVGKSLALGFVRPELAEAGTELEIDVLGEMKPAKIVAESPYDPENAALRG